ARLSWACRRAESLTGIDRSPLRASSSLFFLSGLTSALMATQKVSAVSARPTSRRRNMDCVPPIRSRHSRSPPRGRGEPPVGRRARAVWPLASPGAKSSTLYFYHRRVGVCDAQSPDYLVCPVLSAENPSSGEGEADVEVLRGWQKGSIRRVARV